MWNDVMMTSSHDFFMIFSFFAPLTHKLLSEHGIIQIIILFMPHWANCVEYRTNLKLSWEIWNFYWRNSSAFVHKCNLALVIIIIMEYSSVLSIASYTQRLFHVGGYRCVVVTSCILREVGKPMLAGPSESTMKKSAVTQALPSYRQGREVEPAYYFIVGSFHKLGV